MPKGDTPSHQLPLSRPTFGSPGRLGIFLEEPGPERWVPSELVGRAPFLGTLQPEHQRSSEIFLWERGCLRSGGAGPFKGKQKGCLPGRPKRVRFHVRWEGGSSRLWGGIDLSDPSLEGSRGRIANAGFGFYGNVGCSLFQPPRLPARPDANVLKKCPARV